MAFRKLGLSGGGIKGVMHIGALLELSKHQPLHFPDGVYGISIGAIIGTYVAFGIPLENTTKYLSFDNVIPKPSFATVSKMFSEKGLCSMEMFRAELIRGFSEFGIDIESKKIGDANMPLNIIASNITKGVATIFTRDVSVLDALAASCCLPGLFKPYELYGELFIDGGIFVPCTSCLIPDGLNLFLIKHREISITPANVKEMMPFDFIKQVYDMSMSLHSKRSRSNTTVCLEYPKLVLTSDLDDFDVQDILQKSGDQLKSFLLTKS